MEALCGLLLTLHRRFKPIDGWMKPSFAILCMPINTGTIAMSDANMELMDCLLTNLTQNPKVFMQPQR
jgi:hypothetical protein